MISIVLIVKVDITKVMVVDTTIEDEKIGDRERTKNIGNINEPCTKSVSQTVCIKFKLECHHHNRK